MLSIGLSPFVPFVPFCCSSRSSIPQYATPATPHSHYSSFGSFIFIFAFFDCSVALRLNQGKNKTSRCFLAVAPSSLSSLVGCATHDFFIFFSLLHQTSQRHLALFWFRYCNCSLSSFLVIRSRFRASFRLPLLRQHFTHNFKSLFNVVD